MSIHLTNKWFILFLKFIYNNVILRQEHEIINYSRFFHLIRILETLQPSKCHGFDLSSYFVPLFNWILFKGYYYNRTSVCSWEVLWSFVCSSSYKTNKVLVFLFLCRYCLRRIQHNQLFQQYPHHYHFTHSSFCCHSKIKPGRNSSWDLGIYGIFIKTEQF